MSQPKPLKRFLFGISLISIIWLLGFALFIKQIPSESSALAQRADAIVILTGSSQRIDHAIELLNDGKADSLFISGVGEDANLFAIFDENPRLASDKLAPIADKITLGYEATDTYSNATESAAWIKKNHYESIFLVTANYHLPRSLIEFEYMLPETTIIATPVISSNVKTQQWWKYPSSTLLLASEYNKFIAAFIRSKLRSLAWFG